MIIFLALRLPEPTLHKSVSAAQGSGEAHRKNSDCWFWQQLVARLAALFCNTASSDIYLQPLKWQFLDLFFFFSFYWLVLAVCIHIWKDRAAWVIPVNKYHHPTLPLFLSYYESSILCNMLHFFVNSLTWMVDSIRPNTDCHKTPQKHQFVEESCSWVIWKPFSLLILLLSYHSSIAVICSSLQSPSQKFIYQVEYILTTGQEGRFGKENKQDVYLLKDPCNVLNLIILTAGLKNPDTAKSSTFREYCGRANAWQNWAVSLPGLSCPFWTQHIWVPSVWGPTWPALIS